MLKLIVTISTLYLMVVILNYHLIRYVVPKVKQFREHPIYNIELLLQTISWIPILNIFVLIIFSFLSILIILSNDRT